MYTPPVTSMQFSVLGPLNRPSLFDIRLNDATGALFGPAGTVFDGWCLAMNVFLDVNTASTGTVYSGYELGTLSAAGLPIGTGASALNNLDSINWLINEYNGTNYTWGEIQAAIWALIGDDWTLFSNALGNPDPARVSALTGQALANDGFVPEAGQILGVVLDVRDASGNQQQPTLIEVRAAEMGDRVFEDKNANGVQDVGDLGIAGARLELVRDINGDGDFDDLNEVLATGTTDTLGDYSFKGLTPGLGYQVRFVQPSGYDGASPRQAGANRDVDSDGLVSDVQVLAPGEYRSTIDSGFYKFASLGDRVWLDANRNGQQDFGEGGQAGVVVNLINSAGNIIATQTTVVGGTYLFTSLVPGTYTVEFVAPAGLGFTVANTGNDVSDSDANQDTGRTAAVILNSGDVNRTVDAGLVAQAPQPGRLSGTVLEDRDNNGSGDIPLGGVLIVLKNAAGVEVGRTTTAPDGTYSFNNLTPGNYTVHQTNLAGYNDVGDKDGGDPNSIAATVPAGGQSTGNDFVDDRPASLGDRVWLDQDGDGQQEAGDQNVAGVVVNLLNADGNVVGTQTTNDTGNYLFTNLDAGTYSVQFVKPAGLEFTTANSGADGTDSDANQTTGQTGTYTLFSGDDNRTVDAGLVQPAPQPGHLNGTVFEDRDNNGSGDIPLGGVLIVLKNAAGVEVGRTTTAPDGTYSFNNLTPGNYTVHQTNLAGYNDVGDKDGGNPNSIAATVPAGGQSTGNDFVDDRPASLGDKVFLDTNGNGQQDTGEAGVAGVTVNLLNPAGAVVSTQTTNGTGDYLFTNLDAGTYSVEFVKPANLSFTTANVGADGSDSDASQTTGRTGSYTLVSGETNRSVDAGLVGPQKVCTTVNLQGNSALDGADGNTRTWTDAATGVIVTARAFSQAKGSTTFETAYLGAYNGGLGVTDRYEGNGNSNRHTVDNVDKNNYIVFQFSQAVTMDKVSLGYVVGDSDLQIWVTNSSSTLSSLNAATLSGASFTEVNLVANGNLRTADINNREVMGNIFIIAADTTDKTPDDYFKLSHLQFCAPTTPQPPAAKGSIGDRVWEDKNFNGVQDGGEVGVNGVTVKLLNSAGAVVATTTTNSSGNYVFNGLDAGNYKVHVVSPSGYFVTKQDLGGNDSTDSDINTSGVTGTIALGSGQNITHADAGIYRKASIGDKVFADWNHNGIQDTGEGVVKNVKVLLQNSSGVTIATTTTDKSGMYKFANLDPGTYRIGFDKSNGVQVADNASVKNWQWSKVNVGTDDSRDSDATAAHNAIAYTTYTTLDSGEYDNTWDVGVTPIVIDLDGNGIQTISRSNAGGTFDLFGTGHAVQSGWISGGDGFLAVDMDGNGKIESSAELFGGTGKGAGYAKLGGYDSNGDGMVDMLDTDFAKLLIWQDANGNHQTDAGELMTLAQAGVTSLSLNLVEQNFYVDSEGNVHGETSSATLASGQSVTMTDVYFSVDKADAVAAGAALPTIGELLGTGESELDSLMGASAACATSQQFDDSCAETGELLRKLAALSRADMEQQASLAH